MYTDVNYDGKVNLLDLATLRSYVSKIITSLPEPKEVSYGERKTESDVTPESVPVSSQVPSAEPSDEPSASPTGYVLPWLDNISLKDTAQAAEIIGNYENYNYSDKQKAFLSEMKADGFMYAPDKTADIQTKWNDGVSLYPVSVTEDMYLSYRADGCYVRVYYADKECLKKYGDGNEYLLKSLSQISTLKNAEGTNIYYDNKRALFFIDETHYCVIISDSERSDLIEFAKSLSFEKISFNVVNE